MTKSTHHSFDTDLATKYGIECAILIHHFQHWINHNQRLNINFRDGRTWTYQTREEMAAWFDYLSPDQIRRYTDKLVKMGVLIKGNYNRRGFDKTIWYAFADEDMFTNGKNAKCLAYARENASGKNANVAGENAKPIPDTKTDTKTDLRRGEEGETPQPPPSPPVKKNSIDKKKKAYGSDGLVKLTDDEYKKLNETIPQLTLLIESLNDYIGSTGKIYKSHLHTLRSWHRREAKQANSRKTSGYEQNFARVNAPGELTERVKKSEKCYGME